MNIHTGRIINANKEKQMTIYNQAFNQLQSDLEVLNNV